jgi:DnaK suppressor protein
MNPQQIARLKARLLELRAEIVAAGDMHLEPVRRDVVEKADEDEAPLTEMLQVIASNRNKARAADLEKIDRALVRLEKDPDEFGLCRMCEDEIAEKRLMAMPYVELCVECQSNRDPSRGGARKHLTDYKG